MTACDRIHPATVRLNRQGLGVDGVIMIRRTGFDAETAAPALIAAEHSRFHGRAFA